VSTGAWATGSTEPIEYNNRGHDKMKPDWNKSIENALNGRILKRGLRKRQIVAKLRLLFFHGSKKIGLFRSDVDEVGTPAQISEAVETTALISFATVLWLCV
jgi:hypothetical protein